MWLSYEHEQWEENRSGTWHKHMFELNPEGRKQEEEEGEYPRE